MSNLPNLLKILASLTLISAILAPVASAYPLTEAQEQRIRVFLPKAFEKLKRREPVHVAIVGDGVSQMTTFDENRGNILQSMHGHFLRGLEAEFYYTGGVHLINPIGENPEKLNEHIGPEITVQHFTQPDAGAMSALQMLTTQVFLNQPDIVILSFGQKDLRADVVVDTYRRALESAIRICQDHGAEPIIVGPTPVRDPLEAYGWGSVRLYSQAAQQAATAAGVAFLDPAAALLDTAGVPADGTPEERVRIVSEGLASRFYQYGSERAQPEAIFINTAAHERAGHGLVGQFLNGPAPAILTGGAEATLSGAADMEVSVRLTNTSNEIVANGILTALNVGRAWQPVEPYHEFRIDPGASGEFKIPYRRRVASQIGGPEAFFPSRVNERALDCSFLISDADRTRILDLSAAIVPIAATWDLSGLENQAPIFPLKFNLYNPGDGETSGAYHLTYANQQARGTFRLGSREGRDFEAKCRLPTDRIRSKDKAVLVLEIGDQKLSFEREVEVTRNLCLVKPVPLVRAADYGAGDAPKAGGNESVAMTVDANPAGLTVSFDIEGIGFEEAERRDSMVLELAVDARAIDECRSFGFVAPLRITAGPAAGAGETWSIAPAAFGDGYAKLLSPAGVASELTSQDGGKIHRFVVKIPRIYLYQNEWDLASGSGRIGIGAKLQFLRVDAGSGEFNYPAEARWVTAESALLPNDAAWLTTLEMRSVEPEAWSVRIY